MGIFRRSAKESETINVGGTTLTVVRSLAEDSDTPTYNLDLTQIPDVAHALSVISNDIAQLPLYLYQRTDNGRVRVRDTELARRLAVQPNQYSTAFSFWQRAAYKMLLGNCFILMRPNGWDFLPEDRTYSYKKLSGEWSYGVDFTQKEKIKLNLDTTKRYLKRDYAYKQVLHFSLVKTDNGMAVPLSVKFQAQFALGKGITQYQTDIYARGGALAGYLTTSTPATVPPENKKTNIKAFKKLFRQDTGSGMRLSHLDQGLEFKSVNLSPQELMLIEQDEQFTKKVAGIFNLPLWRLNLNENYPYSSAEQADRNYLQNCLNSWLVQIEQEIFIKTLNEVEQDFIYAEFNRDKLISIDALTMAKIDDIGIKGGWKIPNEPRERLNLTRMPGGDQLQLPAQTFGAIYKEQREALLLQDLAISVQQKQLALQAATVPAETASDETEAIELEADEVEASTPVDRLRDIQRRYAEALFKSMDNGGDAEKAIERSIKAVQGRVWRMLSDGDLPKGLAEFQRKYIASAVQRLETGISAPYEMNRAINALTHEATRHLHGSKAQVRWYGGQHCGVCRCCDEPFEGTLRHPPTSKDDTDCFVWRHTE